MTLTSKVIARNARLECCRRKGEAAHDVEEAEPSDGATGVILAHGNIRRQRYSSTAECASLAPSAPFYVFIKGRWISMKLQCSWRVCICFYNCTTLDAHYEVSYRDPKKWSTSAALHKKHHPPPIQIGTGESPRHEIAAVIPVLGSVFSWLFSGASETTRDPGGHDRPGRIRATIRRYIVPTCVISKTAGTQ